jgi:NADH:ubiquinone oxidoreductase subunit K
MGGPPLEAWLLLAAVLFSIGAYGLMTRKNLVAILLSVELMANAVNINLVAFAAFRDDLLGQAFTLFAIALTVSEVAVGLALVILFYRHHKDIDVDNAELLRG